MVPRSKIELSTEIFPLKVEFGFTVIDSVTGIPLRNAVGNVSDTVAVNGDPD